jgi:uncharacterized protein (TIGR03086 family)
MDRDLIPLLQGVAAEAGRLVANVRPDQWQEPTPCTDWDVGRLVSHFASGLDSFADIGEGKEMATEEPSLEPDQAEGAVASATDRAMAAWRAPGALQRIYPTPWGDTPGNVLVSLLLIETLVHGWDLAKATGQTPAYDVEAVEAAYELSVAYADESTRTPEFFGPEVPVPENAPTLDRLVGFLGRRP